LGLKLKGPASGEAIPSSGGPNAGAKPSLQAPSAHQSRVNGSPASALKRKLPSAAATPNAVSAHTPNKKPRWEDQGTPSSLNKSVSFAEGTKDKAEKKAEKKDKKAAKKKANKTSDAPSDTSLDPSLNYLRQWHTARESWKFNKNHQTLLIKYLFDGDRIPSADIPVFYQYIRDLKGFVRTRLRETAAEIKKADMEAGAGAFPASLKDKETKQKEYEETISRFLQDLQQHHQSQLNDSPINANGKRALEEVEYVLRIATPQVKHRLLKRIRAEMVLGELSDSEDSTTSTAAETATATSTSSSSSASSGRQQQPAAPTTTTTVNTTAATNTTTTTTATTARQSDGSQQPAKRRRLRNVRTAVDDDDSSSSESESSGSESDGESSSSSSSEDDSEDEEMDMGGAAVAAAESSSSSSSSSSEGEDDSEDESGEESGSSGED
jgi:hypothetical protein